MSGTSIKTAMLLVVLSVLVLSVQASITNMTLKELNSTVDTAENLLVLAIDSSQKASRRFAENASVIAAEVQAAYPKLKIVLVNNDEASNENDLIFERFDVLIFPAVLYFHKGAKIEISGKITADKLKTALAARVQAKVQQAKTAADLEKLTGDQFTAYYFSNKEDVHRAFEGLAAKYPKYQVVRTASAKVLADFAAKHKAQVDATKDPIVISRRYHDEVVFTMPDVSDINIQKLNKFIRESNKHYWTYFTSKSVNLIEDTDKHIMFYIFDASKQDQNVELIKEVSKKYYSNLITMFIPRGNQKGMDFLASLGLPVGASDLFIVHHPHEGGTFRYIGEATDLETEDNLHYFIQSCIDHEHELYERSEDLPTRNLFDGLETLVGRNFEQKVHADKEKYHVVFIYDSETASQIPIFQKVSQQFKTQDIKFYIYNSDKNDNSHVSQLHHGTIVLYSGKRKTMIEKSFIFDTLKPTEFVQWLKKRLAADEAVAEQLKSLEVHDDL